MITCYLVDDEQSALDLLAAYIAKIPFLSLVGSTTNPLEALDAVHRQPVDLLFLDIHMPHLSGLDLMRLHKSQAKVVLTTAYSEFALEGFNLDAFDYLLKPIAFERFLKTAQKALNASIDAAARTPAAEESDDEYLFVKTENKGKMTRVNFDEILYVEGMKNYVSIQAGDSSIVTLLNIKDLEERLPARRFLRVHKSYIVALDKIQALDGNQIYLRGLKAHIPLGDTYRAPFFEALQGKVVGGRR